MAAYIYHVSIGKRCERFNTLKAAQQFIAENPKARLFARSAR